MSISSFLAPETAEVVRRTITCDDPPPPCNAPRPDSPEAPATPEPEPKPKPENGLLVLAA